MNPLENAITEVQGDASGWIRPPEGRAGHKTALSFAGTAIQPTVRQRSDNAGVESIFIFADERALFLSRCSR